MVRQRLGPSSRFKVLIVATVVLCVLAPAHQWLASSSSSTRLRQRSYQSKPREADNSTTEENIARAPLEGVREQISPCGAAGGTQGGDTKSEKWQT